MCRRFKLLGSSPWVQAQSSRGSSDIPDSFGARASRCCFTTGHGGRGRKSRRATSPRTPLYIDHAPPAPRRCLGTTGTARAAHHRQASARAGIGPSLGGKLDHAGGFNQVQGCQPIALAHPPGRTRPQVAQENQAPVDASLPGHPPRKCPSEAQKMPSEGFSTSGPPEGGFEGSARLWGLQGPIRLLLPCRPLPPSALPLASPSFAETSRVRSCDA